MGAEIRTIVGGLSVTDTLLSEMQTQTETIDRVKAQLNVLAQALHLFDQAVATSFYFTYPHS